MSDRVRIVLFARGSGKKSKYMADIYRRPMLDNLMNLGCRLFSSHRVSLSRPFNLFLHYIDGYSTASIPACPTCPIDPSCSSNQF